MLDVRHIRRIIHLALLYIKLIPRSPRNKNTATYDKIKSTLDDNAG